MVVIFAVITAAGFGSYYATTIQPPKARSGAESPTTPYELTLVEVMQNMWNSSGVMQPKIFVLGDHGLESTANISLPAHRLIQLTIFSYDTVTPNSTDAQGVVSGTEGNSVYIINGSVASGTADVDMAMAADWGTNVTSIPGSDLVGTFTIAQLGINVPFVSDSATVAYFEINQTGKFTWVCLTPCGLGPNLELGAMDTAGWMMGGVTVS